MFVASRFILSFGFAAIALGCAGSEGTTGSAGALLTVGDQCGFVAAAYCDRLTACTPSRPPNAGTLKTVGDQCGAIAEAYCAGKVACGVAEPDCLARNKEACCDGATGCDTAAAGDDASIGSCTDALVARTCDAWSNASSLPESCQSVVAPADATPLHDACITEVRASCCLGACDALAASNQDDLDPCKAEFDSMACGDVGRFVPAKCQHAVRVAVRR